MAGEGTGIEPSNPDMGDLGTHSREPLCPPLQCNQDEICLTLLIQVPRIQPQSLQGHLTPFWYKLCFSTEDLVYYSFFLQFGSENKLSTKEPVVSISSNNAVIELAKSAECYGHWREWYYGLNNDSLEVTVLFRSLIFEIFHPAFLHLLLQASSHLIQNKAFSII